MCTMTGNNLWEALPTVKLTSCCYCCCCFNFVRKLIQVYSKLNCLEAFLMSLKRRMDTYQIKSFEIDDIQSFLIYKKNNLNGSSSFCYVDTIKFSL